MKNESVTKYRMRVAVDGRTICDDSAVRNVKCTGSVEAGRYADAIGKVVTVFTLRRRTPNVSLLEIPIHRLLCLFVAILRHKLD